MGDQPEAASKFAVMCGSIDDAADIAVPFEEVP